VGPFENTLQEHKGSALVERYAALLRTVESRAVLLGAETRLIHLPKSNSEPFVLEYRQETSGKAGLIFLYRPDLELLTSEAISFLANRILSFEGTERSILILLAKESFLSVQNVMRVTNLISHAAISAYQKQGLLFNMDWDLPS
jgi:hypothetical protein